MVGYGCSGGGVWRSVGVYVVEMMGCGGVEVMVGWKWCVSKRIHGEAMVKEERVYSDWIIGCWSHIVRRELLLGNRVVVVYSCYSI